MAASVYKESTAVITQPVGVRTNKLSTYVVTGPVGANAYKISTYVITIAFHSAQSAKVTSYAVMQFYGAKVPKVTAYAVVDFKGAHAAKVTGYAVMLPHYMKSPKTAAYAVMLAPVMKSTKVVGYAVVDGFLAQSYATQSRAQAMVTKAVGLLKATHTSVRVMAKVVSNGDIEVTRSVARFMVKRNMDFSWIDDMFKNIMFPHDISYNSIGAARHESDDISVDSGYSQRTSRWAFPLMEYDVAYGVRTLEQLHSLIQFNRVVKGTVYAFLFEDKVDNASQFATRVEARSVNAPTPFDQLLGVGNGRTYQFQLQKKYAIPTLDGLSEEAIYRKITKPQPNSVLVGVNGTRVVTFTVDYQRGLVIFTPNTTITVAGALSISAPDSNNNCTITGPSGTFTPAMFAFGKHIVMQGWSNVLNNTTADQVVEVKTAGSSSIVVNVPPGYGAAETGRTGVTFLAHPAPDAGAQITAGFKFFVPVRFNTKRLPVTLEEYGVGSATEVKLVEVRLGETL